MSNSRDYNTLKEAWVNWRESVGKPNRHLYQQYVRLGNKAAVLNGFKTLDDLWLFDWETKHFKQQMQSLWAQIQPFYQKLHAFVRMNLREYYPNKIPSDGTIPAHLLGNMWAQTWNNIQEMMIPFPKKKSVDVTNRLKEQVKGL